MSGLVAKRSDSGGKMTEAVDNDAAAYEQRK